MATTTNIQWSSMLDPATGELIHGGTLNIGGGCSMVPTNPACKNCYAMSVTAGLDKKMKGTALKMLQEGGSDERASRLHGMYDGTTKTVNGIEVWTGKVIAHPWRINEFLRKTAKKPWFVSSCTDFWHDGYDDNYLAQWLGAFAVQPTQRILLLTKRVERQRKCLSDAAFQQLVVQHARAHIDMNPQLKHLVMPSTWPLPNLWTGASAGEHKVLVKILEDLIYTPSACQWVSAEPLYADPMVKEALDRFPADDLRQLKWIIFGGESGARARPMDLAWVERGIADCQARGIAAFVKQKGEVLAKSMQCQDKKGGDMLEWPESIRVREYPMVSEAA